MFVQRHWVHKGRHTRKAYINRATGSGVAGSNSRLTVSCVMNQVRPVISMTVLAFKGCLKVRTEVVINDFIEVYLTIGSVARLKRPTFVKTSVASEFQYVARK